MTTPIIDFVRRYIDSGALRMHMPGHKGRGVLGFEQFDITEFDGADSLYEADGIIRESEENASRIFGAPTFYSAEGSSLCIRAMVHLTCLYAAQKGEEPLIWAARNSHSTFVSACALCGAEAQWLHGGGSYLKCVVEPERLDGMLKNAERKPHAVYITSPDYLGNISDIRGLSAVCRDHGVLLMVDGAHGAYLRFLENSLHPMDLGAHVACASAHKTLPVVTGGAYLHVSPDAPQIFAHEAKRAMHLFGSTSPSYLILESLDGANAALAGDYPQRLRETIAMIGGLRGELERHGYTLCGDEPTKLTIHARAFGYTGTELARKLSEQEIFSEFYDPDYLVLMLTPETGREGIDRLRRALLAIEPREPMTDAPPSMAVPERCMTMRQAMFAPREVVAAAESEGRILAAGSVGCPPAVPIVVSGEKIGPGHVKCFEYYGIHECAVVK